MLPTCHPKRGMNMMKVLSLAIALIAFAGTVSAESVTARVGGQLWKFDLAKACQTQEVVWVLGGVQTTTWAQDGRLIIAGVDSGYQCPITLKKKRTGSGGGSKGFVSNLEVAVKPDGSPVLNPGEVVVSVGNTNIGSTPVTGIGGTGVYTPVNDQPASQPTVEPVDVTNTDEVSAGFGPVNN